MTNSKSDVFWNWSLTRYHRPGVETALLRLQDDFGCNANILLWLCWIAEAFGPVPDIVVKKAVDTTSAWNREVTGKLRQARRSLKTSNDAGEAGELLREQIKKAELEAEHIEQTLLERLAASTLTASGEKVRADILRDARRNLAAYAATAGAARIKGFSTSLLHTLIDHIFNDNHEAAAEKACANE